MAKEKDILAKIGDYLGKQAKAKFRSNVEFANVADVDEKTIRLILSGKHNITVRKLEKICDALEISFADLFNEVGVVSKK